MLCNWAFHNLDITINPETYQPLIYDIENAEMLSDGSLKKRDRNDPTTVRRVGWGPGTQLLTGIL